MEGVHPAPYYYKLNAFLYKKITDEFGPKLEDKRVIIERRERRDRRNHERRKRHDRSEKRYEKHFFTNFPNII